MLHLFWSKVREQDLITLDLEPVVLYIVDLKLLAVVDWIVRVADQLKSHIVSITETARALGRDVIVRILNDLVAQECEGNIVQLEVIQIVFSAHIQEQIHT